MNSLFEWVVDHNESPSNANLKGHSAQCVVHRAHSQGFTESELNSAVIHCIDKAVSLLSENISDESRYFLFEWDASHSCLSVVVTDDTKKKDESQVVTMQLNDWSKMNSDDPSFVREHFSEILREWIHNYLTTCGGFMKYSLIAIFHSDTRNKTVLL
jgi:hypothetical protein